MAGRCLVPSEIMLQAVTPNETLMLKRAGENLATVTDLADLLVAEANLSFRKAHHIASHIVRVCMENGLRTEDTTAQLLADASTQVIGRKIRLTAEGIRTRLEPRKAVEPRIHPGGTARRRCVKPSKICRQIS